MESSKVNGIFIAVFINTFRGVFEPYGIFSDPDRANDWIEDIGVKKENRGDYGLWSVFEVTVVT